MLDAFDDMCDLKSSEKYETFLDKNKNFIAFREVTVNEATIEEENVIDNKNTNDIKKVQIVFPKINLLFASLANTDGEIKIGDEIYNFLDEEVALKTTKLFLDYYKNRNQEKWDIFVTIPDFLPILIPMSAAHFIPIWYPTAFYTTNIGGRSVIVQLWKGYCPGIFGYAGGVGAEVGLYRRASWTNRIWYPDYRNKKDISYKLIRRSNNNEIYSFSRHTWWLNRWKKNWVGLPMTGNSYRLDYTIDGVRRIW